MTLKGVFFNAMRKDDNMIDLKQGDCLELMKEIPDNSIDMVLCDLPYQVTNLKWDKKINSEKLFVQYRRIVKDKGNIVLFGTNPFASELIQAGKDLFKYDWVWKKSNGGFAYAKQRPLGRHELILVFGKSNSSYYPQMELVEGKIRDRRKENFFKTTDKNLSNSPVNKGTKMAYSSGYNPNYKNPIDVIFHSNHFEKSAKYHPTQKPVELLEYLIKTYTRDNDIVLDNCMGSGSTGVACVNTKRDFIGMELDKEYFHIAEKRIQEAQSEIRLDV